MNEIIETWQRGRMWGLSRIYRWRPKCFQIHYQSSSIPRCLLEADEAKGDFCASFPAEADEADAGSGWSRWSRYPSCRDFQVSGFIMDCLRKVSMRASTREYYDITFLPAVGPSGLCVCEKLPLQSKCFWVSVRPLEKHHQGVPWWGRWCLWPKHQIYSHWELPMN